MVAPFQLGEWNVRPASNELVGTGGTERIRPILMVLLVRLAASHGQPVSRETLVADVWPRRMVNDEVLSRAVAELRGALGDSTREPRYIETIPKVGYRLIASVSASPTHVEPAAEPVAASVAMISVEPTASNAGTAPPARKPNLDRTRKFRAGAIAAMTMLLGLLSVWLVLRPAPPSTDAGRAAAFAKSLAGRIAVAENLTADIGQEQLPRLSPDGTRVAFSLRRDAPVGAASQVVIQDLATQRREIIEDKDATGDTVQASGPVFHPDGKQLAYYRQSRDDGRCGVVLRDLTNGQEKVLVECARRPRIMFDLSARALIFAAPPAPDLPTSLALMDLATLQIRWLTRGAPGDGHDMTPRFDATGQRVAFVRGTDSHREVWVMNTNNPKTARRVGPAEGQVFGVVWLDRDRLLVASDWHGTRALNLVDIKSGQSTPLGGRGARYPDVAQNGLMVYESAVYRADLWESSTAAPGQEAELRWPSTRYTNQAEYSPDGSRVAFVSNRDQHEHIYVASRGEEPRRVTWSRHGRYIRPHWSGDGQRLYATRIDGGAGAQQYRAVVIDTATTAETVLSDLGSSVADVREWDHTGALLVAEHERHAFRLSVVDKAGARTRLPLPLVSHFDRRSNRLAYALPQLSGLTICSLPTLHCTQQAIAIDDRNRFDWALGDDAVWFREAGAQGRLIRHPLDGSEAKAFDHGPTAAGVNIAIDPSGRQLLLARETAPAIDIHLVRPR